jgi:peptidoglycan/xylan/chitin deacetylase (PgdA/CDA1 family)
VSRRLASRPQRDERLPILAYHFTGEPADAEDAPYTLSSALFEQEMCFLVESGYRAITLDEVVAAIAGHQAWPERGVVITFDDGRACIYHHAFPILKKHGLGATVFLLSSRLSRTGYLAVDQIKEMADHGIEFQSHGHSHRNFSGLTRAEIESDTGESKAALERVLGRDVSFFAFPYGGLNPVAAEVLGANGYRGAVCSRTGCAQRSSAVFELPRLGMRGSDTVESFARKLDIGRPRGLLERARDRLAGALGRLRP